MRSKEILTHHEVKAILAAAEAEAIKNNWGVTIAVVDDGGHLLSLQRLESAAAISVDIAAGKAKAAALARRETKVFEDMINDGRYAFVTASNVKGLLEGGVPIFHNGHCLGAIGVAGVKPFEDVQIAKAGIAALTLNSL